MTGKRNLFLGLLIGLVLGGALSAFLSFHDWTSAQDSRTVLLRQGWNQLVWTADNQPADTALAAIAGDLVIVYGWQGDSQTFTRYIPDRADVSTMAEVEKNSGYWLLMTREVAFSFPTADGQQCPQPTACPSPSPSAGCEGCASLLATCVSALDECDESFWGMADLLDECQADRSYLQDDVISCESDLIFCEGDVFLCQGDLSFCQIDLAFYQSLLSCFEDECGPFGGDFEDCCW